MKTIEELNRRWWYRLIKSIYIITLTIFLLIGAWMTYDSNRPTQSTDFRVNCNYGNKSTFLAEQDKGIFLDPSPFNSQNTYTQIVAETESNNAYKMADLTDFERTELQTACGYSDQYVMDQLQTFMAAEKAGQPLPFPLFTLTNVQSTRGSTTNAILYSIMAAAIICAVFEIVRRIFYYVVLDSLKPTKNH